jgi:hypothetical protein
MPSIRCPHLNLETMRPLIRDRHLHLETGRLRETRRLRCGTKTCCSRAFQVAPRGENSLFLCSGNKSDRHVKAVRPVFGLYRVSLDLGFRFRHILLKFNGVSNNRPPFARIFNSLLQNKNKLWDSRRKKRSSTENSVRASRDGTKQLLQTLKHEKPLSYKDDARRFFFIQSSHFHLLRYNLSKNPKNAFRWYVYKQPAPWDRHHFASSNHVIQATKPLPSIFAWLKSPFSDFFFTHSLIQYMLR